MLAIIPKSGLQRPMCLPSECGRQATLLISRWIELMTLCMCSLIVFFAIYSGIVNNFRFSRFVR